MILAYIDESGDPGVYNSPTNFFILSCILVDTKSWNIFLDDSKEFRRTLRDNYGIKLRQEIHVNEMFNNKQFNHLKLHQKITVCKKVIDFIDSKNYLKVFFVSVDKHNFSDSDAVFNRAWKYLIQRIENTCKTQQKDFMICPDNTSKNLTTALRTMRRYNPVPRRFGPVDYANIPIVKAIEDPFYKDSTGSFFVQFADLLAYFFKQQQEPSAYFLRDRKNRYLLDKRLNNNLLIEVSRDENGIVQINK